MAKNNHIGPLDWTNSRNLAGHPVGLVRSILGYAGESIVIGRALACGYNLFFKAWRDSKYDAVLDANSSLFRIEIKQSGDGSNISCTSGGRSGAQISRVANSRETVLSPEESDFLIGVHTFTGRCWIVPTEVVYFRDRKSNSTISLSDYEEKWAIFANPPLGFTLEEIRQGFRNFSEPQLANIAKNLGLNGPPNLRYSLGHRTKPITLPDNSAWYVLEIWRKIFQAI